mgnify:CR=1 FL=1
MNKSFLKFLTDFGPLVIFFYYYYDSGKDLRIAIPPLIVATIIALAIVWFLEKKIPKVPLLSGLLITFFGGLTIYFDNPIFIYLKPTIINILFGLALLSGKFFTKEPLLKKMLGNVGIDEEYLLFQAKNIIDNIDGRDSDKLRAIEMLMKISGMFPNDKKTESLTVFQGFTSEQLKELEPSKVNVIGHAEKDIS